jgi:urease accessory protein
MLRALAVLPPGHTKGTPIDRVVLVHDERRLRRKLLRTAGGREFMIDLPRTVTLEHAQLLQLDGGDTIEVIAAHELLYEIRGTSPAHLVRLAWHIGNRHASAQLEQTRILIKRDHVLKTMLEGLGATVADVTEPFLAEHGAYHSHGEHDHALLAR